MSEKISKVEPKKAPTQTGEKYYLPAYGKTVYASSIKDAINKVKERR